MLQSPAALADHADRLLLRGDQSLGNTQQLGRAGAGGYVERDQRPVPVAGQPREQVVERLVGNAPRRGLGLLRLVGALRDGRRNGCMGLWWALSCPSSAPLAWGNGLTSGRPCISRWYS